MVLNKFTGSTKMDGTEQSLFKIVGTTMKHFASYVYLKALQAGESIRLRVYNKVDDVSQWKFDGDATDSVSTNNGTITNISSWVSQWKFDGNVNDSVGSNNGTITYHTNLKRLYKFESNLNDSTGTANGTLAAGTATYITGQEGNAFSFDGSSYITASDTGLPIGTNVVSVSAWLKFSSLTSQPMYFGYGVSGAHTQFDLFITSGGIISFYDGTTATNISTTALQLNTWYHVTVAYNGTNALVYINGVLDKTTAITVNTSLAGASGITLGAISGGGANKMTGLMDELRTYNIVLSQAQVSALYMNGKFAQSHTFDGGEYITFGTNTTFNFERTNTFSVSCWIKSPNALSQSFVGFIGKLDSNAVGWSVGQNGTAVEVLLINSNNINQIKVHAGNISDGNWHHVVMTYSGTSLASGILIYIDGISQTIVVDNDTLSASILNTVVPNIGALEFNGNQPYTGQLDEVRVYNVVLTASQVIGLYNYTGSNYVTPLPVGNALSLDGSSYVTVTNTTPYNFERTNSFSISFWVKTTATGVIQTYFSKMDSSYTNGYQVGFDTNNQIYVSLRNTTNTNDILIHASGTINDGNWHNVIVTYAGTSLASGILVYIDNVLSTNTVNRNGLSATILNSANVTIGSTAGTGNTTGLMDEVEVWNYVVSSAERNAINAGRFANTHPIGLWHFDGDLYDYSGQGSTGSPTGTMTYVTGALSGSYNVPNTHFNFDGSEYVPTTITPFNWEKTQSFSVAFWIRTIDTATTAILSNNAGGATGWDILFVNGKIYLDLINTNNTNQLEVNSTGTVNDGLWHQVFVIYNGTPNTSGVSFYIDGVQSTTVAGINNLTATIISASALTIGANVGNGSSRPFVGEIDDLRVYNRVLSSAEVSDLYTYPDSEMKSLMYDRTYSGPLPDTKYSPYLQGNQFMVTALQTGGTNRIVSWEREESTG